MCSIHCFSNINWLSVIVVTVLTFPLGAFWHSGVMFGKAWKEEVQSSFDKSKVNFPLLFGSSAVLHFIALTGLDALIGQDSTWANGLHAGLFVGVFFVFPTIAVTHLFAGRKWCLILIDTGLYIVMLSIAGLIFGIW